MTRAVILLSHDLQKVNMFSGRIGALPRFIYILNPLLSSSSTRPEWPYDLAITELGFMARFDLTSCLFTLLNICSPGQSQCFYSQVREGNAESCHIYLYIPLGTVLGLSANFASIFLPRIHRMSPIQPRRYTSLTELNIGDFTIFSLIVPSLTILLFLITCVFQLHDIWRHWQSIMLVDRLQWAQPRTEAVMLLILGILWLSKSLHCFRRMF